MARFHFLLVAITLLAFFHGGQPCGVVDWRPKSVAEQAGEAEIIVYGAITEHYPMPDVPLDRVSIINT